MPATDSVSANWTARGAATLVRVCAAATLHGAEVSWSELLSTGCLPDGINSNEAGEVVLAVQRALAAAAVRGAAAGVAPAPASSSLPAPLREALSDYWRENSARVAVWAAAGVAGAGCAAPVLSSMHWRVGASSAAGSMGAPPSVADATPLPPPAATITFELAPIGGGVVGSSAAAGSGRCIVASAGREALAAALAAVEAARATAEHLADEGSRG